MNNLQLFENPKFGQIRVVQMNNESMFCLVDVCRALDLQNPVHTKNQITEEFGDDLHQMYPISDNLGRTQQALFITEPQLYFVMNRSDKPQAKSFRMWVNSEVLPSIRKHGAYLTSNKIEEVLQNPDLIIGLATKLKEEQKMNQILQSQNQAQAQELQKQAPKVLFTDAVMGSQSSCLVGELAKIITQNGYPIGEKRLFKWLRDNHYLGMKGERYNIPNQQYIEQGLFELKKGTRSGNNGVMHTTITPKITGKGQVYFVNKFLKKVA